MSVVPVGDIFFLFFYILRMCVVCCFFWRGFLLSTMGGLNGACGGIAKLGLWWMELAFVG